ncbi:PREDICTED: uncharacterized protein LOC109486145 [Branchiostoma belcheri]|uniref:Uncharacterized protein LOC109486145 n=1 Tax=Branchiostoma belcheri TaxID=7741 RepID=A0A6P5AGF2_BRABE|nr:PREDICTED: uncharacterized protein LOC109486145 [Branchiostoma belcheri]
MRTRTLQSKARRYKPTFFKPSHHWVSSPWSKTDVHKKHLYDTRVTRFLPGVQRTHLSETSSVRTSSQFAGTVKDLESYEKIFESEVRYRLPRPIIDPQAFQDDRPRSIFGDDGQSAITVGTRSYPDVDDIGSASVMSFRIARPEMSPQALLAIEENPSNARSRDIGWDDRSGGVTPFRITRAEINPTLLAIEGNPSVVMPRDIRWDSRSDVSMRRCNPDVDDLDTDSSVLMTDSDGRVDLTQRYLAASRYSQELQSITEASSRRTSYTSADQSVRSRSVDSRFFDEDTITETSSFSSDVSTVTDITGSTVTRTDTESISTVDSNAPQNLPYPFHLLPSLNRRYMTDNNVRHEPF